MTKDRTSGRPGPDLSPFSAEEAAFARSPYYDDVAQLLGTLNVCLPTYKARLSPDTYRLVRGNLQVLTECFYGEPLSSEVLEVVREHLQMLTRMLAFRVN